MICVDGQGSMRNDGVQEIESRRWGGAGEVPLVRIGIAELQNAEEYDRRTVSSQGVEEGVHFNRDVGGFPWSLAGKAALSAGWEAGEQASAGGSGHVVQPSRVLARGAPARMHGVVVDCWLA